MKWAVVQIGYTIFGVGKTPLGAVRDANKWLDEKISVADVQDEDPRIHGNLVLLICSDELYEYIRGSGAPDRGWSIISLRGGRNAVVTDREADEHG